MQTELLLVCVLGFPYNGIKLLVQSEPKYVIMLFSAAADVVAREWLFFINENENLL